MKQTTRHQVSMTKADILNSFHYILYFNLKLEIMSFRIKYLIFIISAIAEIMKSELGGFFQSAFVSDSEYLLKNSDILFGSEYKREI